jgi:hypothetical protein
MRFMHLLTQPRRGPQRPTSPGNTSPNGRSARPGDGPRRLPTPRNR